MVVVMGSVRVVEVVLRWLAGDFPQKLVERVMLWRVATRVPSSTIPPRPIISAAALPSASAILMTSLVDHVLDEAMVTCVSESTVEIATAVLAPMMIDMPGLMYYVELTGSGAQGPPL